MQMCVYTFYLRMRMGTISVDRCFALTSVFIYVRIQHIYIYIYSYLYVYVFAYVYV